MISFDGVSKCYRGWMGQETRALENFSLDVNEGEVFGLAGPNGAGKSTLIALLLGYLGPTAGTVRVGGADPRAYVERHGVGYLSELINIPPAWRAGDALERYAILSGVQRTSLKARVDASSRSSAWRSIARSACGNSRRATCSGWASRRPCFRMPAW